MDKIIDSSSNGEVAHDFPPYFKVFKDGRIHRYRNFTATPPGLDKDTGIESKDVEVSTETGVKARIFMPKLNSPNQKFPLLVHFHGGGFCLGTAFDLPFKSFLTAIVAHANVIAVTIDYRRPPEHLLPTAHHDSFTALKWVASHANGKGPETWLNDHADFGRVFLAGESAGANIANYVAVQAGATGLTGLNIFGTISVHPYFGAKEPDKMIDYMNPKGGGFDKDPIINPAVDPNLKSMSSKKVLVCVAEKDILKSRGVYYYECLSKSAWGGKVELYETVGEDHCFHFFNPKSEQVPIFIKKLVEFIKS